MAEPGWFPDPAGQPGLFRYWDGAAWTQQLSRHPSGPTGSTPGRGRPSGWWTWIAAAVAVVLLVLFVVPRWLSGGDPAPTPRRSAPTSSPTASGWDETTRPTPAPTRTRTEPTPTPTPTTSPPAGVPCPPQDAAVAGGRLFGGGLSVPLIDDSRWDVQPVRTIPWAACATGLRREIAPSWVSEVVLAGVQPAAITGSLRQQAESIARDSVDRFYFPGEGRFAAGTSRAVTIDGHKGWELRYRVLVDRPSIPGDVVNVLVVQHRTGRSVLMTFATIGDDATQRQVDRARRGVRAERR